jgi:hypothetical protein
MPTWSITSTGEARELYEIEAETEEEARAKFKNGDVGLRGPYMTEVSDSEIEEISQVD